MSGTAQLAVRSMRAEDVAAADAVYRLAFGTAFKLPEPLKFRGDSQVIGTRRLAWPEATFVATRGDAIIGSVTGTRMGSAVLLGPITVHPEHWNGGVARALLARFMAVESVAQASFIGLFTFPDSAKHIALYESLGFAPRYLTAVLSIEPRAGSSALLLSGLSASERTSAVDQCRARAQATYPGLDATGEIEATAARNLGDTVLVRDARGAVVGFAICHAGPGTEAGSGLVFVKFGLAARGYADAFAALLDGCRQFAAARGARALRAGLNTARRSAYRAMRASGFRVELTGVAMHRPDVDAWSSEHSLVIDDWR